MAWQKLYDLLLLESEQTRDAVARNPDIVPLADDLGVLVAKLGKQRAAKFHAQRLINNEQTATDLACRHFAGERKWPLMSAATTWAVSQRVCHASEFLEFVVRPDSRTSDFSDTLPHNMRESDLLAWLLVDYWHIAGETRWRAMLSEEID